MLLFLAQVIANVHPKPQFRQKELPPFIREEARWIVGSIQNSFLKGRFLYEKHLYILRRFSKGGLYGWIGTQGVKGKRDY